MTLTEFKAWFEGFTENITKQPTQKQWARIQARVAEIEPEPLPPTVIEKHVPYRPWWPQWYTPLWSEVTTTKDISPEITWTCEAKAVGQDEWSNISNSATITT